MNKKARPPPHPGEVLREDVLPGLGITIAQLAANLRLSNQTLYLLCRELVGISPSTALRLGAYLNCDPELWMTMQAKHDLWHKERSIGPDLERIRKRGNGGKNA